LGKLMGEDTSAHTVAPAAALRDDAALTDDAGVDIGAGVTHMNVSCHAYE